MPTGTSPKERRWRSRRCSDGREHIAPRTDGLGLVIEDRHYPESSGPGAGCPTEHGLTTSPGLELP